MKRRNISLASALLLVSGCSPLFSSDMRDLAQALGHDAASLCVRASGGAGGVGIVPGAIAPSGGYGALTICRSNQPGTVIQVDGDTITIMHGVKDPPSAAVEKSGAAAKGLIATLP